MAYNASTDSSEVDRQTQFRNALYQDNVEKARLLLRRGANLNRGCVYNMINPNSLKQRCFMPTHQPILNLLDYAMIFCSAKMVDMLFEYTPGIDRPVVHALQGSRCNAGRDGVRINTHICWNNYIMAAAWYNHPSTAILFDQLASMGCVDGSHELFYQAEKWYHKRELLDAIPCIDHETEASRRLQKVFDLCSCHVYLMDNQTSILIAMNDLHIARMCLERFTWSDDNKFLIEAARMGRWEMFRLIHTFDRNWPNREWVPNIIIKSESNLVRQALLSGRSRWSPQMHFVGTSKWMHEIVQVCMALQVCKEGNPWVMLPREVIYYILAFVDEKETFHIPITFGRG